MARTTQSAVEPKLDKPGAGLPFFEWFVAKYLLLPYRFQTISDAKALVYFKRQQEQIVQIASELSPESLVERRLIPRQLGIEDSSRFWSVAMTLQHLNIVNDSMRQVITELSAGRSITRTASTADVKPRTDAGGEGAIDLFIKICDEFSQDAGAVNKNAYPNVTYTHPWFGKLNAHQWLVMASTHMQIHHGQIKEIVSLL